MPGDDHGTESGQLTVYLNSAEHTIPNTVETVADLHRALDLHHEIYYLYRDEDVETLGKEQRLRESRDADPHAQEPVVVSDGDEFVAVQQTVVGG